METICVCKSESKPGSTQNATALHHFRETRQARQHSGDFIGRSSILASDRQAIAHAFEIAAGARNSDGTACVWFWHALGIIWPVIVAGFVIAAFAPV
ncbi:MAG: hypothetical protein ACKVHE_22355 [Planctomycetales bacterium]